MDPITLMMFALIAVMIFFMFRNGKKRKAAQEDMQNNMRPGAEVMLQSGIFATLEEIDEETNRATVRSGNSTFVVHRNAISQVVTPNEGADATEQEADLAPDDDPAFGERVANGEQAAAEPIEAVETIEVAETETPDAENGETPNPKA